MKRLFFVLIIALAISFSCTKDGGNMDVAVSGDGAGQGGSMAKFSISGDHLFVINETTLKTYNISNAEQPYFVSDVQVDFGIETVFTLGDHLFIGSINGMYIYDISNPANIKYLSYYQHITSCDPVVANDSLAFVTLNSTTSCSWNNGANRLDVLDISNKIDPQLLSSYDLAGPKGLGINDQYVFVCNGSEGVEIYDYTNPHSLEKVARISGIESYDVIIRSDRLYLIGADGLFQYDITDVYSISLISNMLFN